MSASKAAGPTFGFIRIVDLGAAASIGGYLLLNALGRPVEFHCSEMVRTNRAQQILFGESLKPFIYGEQIGRALVENSTLKPEVIFGDSWPILALGSITAQPVVGVVTEPDVILPPSYLSFQVGDQSFFVRAEHGEDRSKVEEILQRNLVGWDLCEPFQRIQEAVSELQKAA